MKHISVNELLPEHLILEIQKYVQGEYIYIPKPLELKKKWGTTTDTKRILNERNKSIRAAFLKGDSIDLLAEEYFLSVSTIKRIVYSKKENHLTSVG